MIVSVELLYTGYGKIAHRALNPLLRLSRLVCRPVLLYPFKFDVRVNDCIVSDIRLQPRGQAIELTHSKCVDAVLPALLEILLDLLTCCSNGMQNLREFLLEFLEDDN